MYILALDTCFDGCSACIAEHQGRAVSVLSARRARFETGHAERLIPMVGEVVAEAGLGFHHIRRIAVTVGPGTFTGTRIGVAAARAFALATGAETVGVSSLAVMAELAQRQVGTIPLAVVVDARRGEVYAQSFGTAGGSDASTPPALLSLEDASRVAGEGDIVFVGSGAAAVAAIARARGRAATALLPDLLPDATAVAELAARSPGCTTTVAPLYLRPPDAKPQDGKAVARA